MSSPIETNTEELQEILQTVYNLPNAGGGGSEPDLLITTDENFIIGSKSLNQTYNAEQILFDPNKVISAYEKLMAGKGVNAVITGYMGLNSYSPEFMTSHSAMRVIGYEDDFAKFLVVRFLMAAEYFFLSADGSHCAVEYRFQISHDTGEVRLSGVGVWNRQ